MYYTVLLCYCVTQSASTPPSQVEVASGGECVDQPVDTRTVCGVGGEDSVWRVVLLAAPSGHK